MTNLKRIIDEKGVQQRWLAEQVGVTEVSMSRYVNGERIPKAPMAIRMADVLGVDVKDLYGWDDAHVIGENEAQPETHEERTETHGVCLDTISRQAAIDALKEHRNLFCDNTPETFSVLPYGDKCRVDELDMAIATLINLPSVQPDSKELSFTHKALDTISRQAAIDAMSEAYEKDEIWEDYEKRLNELPSAQHWIPCSKALPKIGNRVIGTYKNSLFKNGPYVVRIMRREKKYWVGDDEHWFLYENILAWQPLPEPYREEGD